MDFEYRERLLEAVWPHIESFNCFLLTGLSNIVINLPSIYIDSDYVIDDCELNVGYIPREYLRIKVTCIKVGKPIFGSTESSNTKMYPCSARNGHLSYSAPLWIEFECYNSFSKSSVRHNLFAGSIPIMVRSLACHLYSLSPNELVANGEDPNEVGGYFIINGNERVIRYVIQQRCNYPVGLKRSRFTSRDIFGTEYAILLRSLRNDGSSTANYLYGTTDNQCVYRILLNRQEWLLPFWNVLLAVGSIYDAKTLRNKILQYCCNTRDEYDPLYSVINMLTIEWGLDNSSGVENSVIPPSYDGAFGDIEIIENRHLHNLGKLVWEGVVFYLPPGSLYQDAGRFIIDNHILVHLPEWNAKLECLILMFTKLLKLQYGQIREESIDSFAYQEILSSGNLYASVLKDAIFSFLQKIRMIYITEIRNRNFSKSEKEASDELPLPYSSAALDLLRDDSFFKTSLIRNISMIPKRIQYFMATGNIKTTQLDLQQLSGWTVVADRLNFNRFLSHFRAVHRGQFFTTMKTTDVRKLMGETWGFLCPVHTPDGEPCGLLLHLSQDTILVTQFEIQSTLKNLRDYLVGQNIPCDDGLGTLSIQWGSLNLDDIYVPDLSKSVPVMLDGRVMFHIPKSKFTFWQEKLRNLKWSKTPSILPIHTEIACIPPDCGVFSGIFMFTAPGRLVRPVLHLKSNKIDWIGPLAQPWMDIGVTEEETQKSIKLYNLQMKLFGLYRNDNITSDIETTDNMDKNQIEEMIKKDYTLGCNPVMYTHQELHPSTILSITASLIPYAHHNQSPRNMYQCQMLKQTMGTPCYSYPYRTDNRMYRIITPQNPLVITKGYASYGFSEYPTGTNAIVAVISHSGYDMEDAMVLNKASYERGIFHACVYKTKILFAAPNSVIKKSDAESYRFHNIGPDGKLVIKELGADGLPMIGQKLVKGSPMCRVEKLGSGGVISNAIVQTYHDDEEAYVEKINRVGSGLSTESHSDSTLGGSGGPGGSEYSSGYGEKISLKLRIVRNPMVGDKFASRHGQKGILSMLWPHENMPFGESGIVPDILFNPHGFPSRMTVGMLIECMAGKAACLHGASALDATPFHRNITDKQTILEDKEMGIDSSKQSTVDYFGKALLKTGFQYFGCEPLFNGMTGTEMPCHIFMGVIYYQRLRHMVADKAQVRSTGPIDALTRQPVKGRKRHGGIRFGEMERDSLISYGVSSIIADRLLKCSDEHKAYVCPYCGLIFSAILPRKTTNFQNRLATTLPHVAICKVCKTPCRLITLPYVFRYLCNELATMNIVIRLELEQEDVPISIRSIKDKSS